MNNNKVKMSTSNQLPSIDKIFKEDDDDFTPSVGSNLAAIFGTPQKTLETSRSVNSPLRHGSAKNYTTDQSQSQTSSVPKKEVILAKAVHAYKLQNGQYVSIGKVGIALAGSAVAKQYDIILYKGTQDYISTVAITSDFCYTVQANNYASYYDGNKNNWSILFDNRESSIQFAREICVSKYSTRQNKIDGNIIYQDLSAAGKDTNAKEGDGISIKYLTSLDLSQPLKIDNNLKETNTLEISKDDNWERLLVGTSMGLRRIMILPSNKQIGLGPGFPKDREIIMEIEVVSVFAKQDPPPPIAKPPEVSQKATIISRMAKMGQSILPKLPPSTTTDSEDTEEEVFHKASRHKRMEAGDSLLQRKPSYSNQSSDVVHQNKVINRGELMPSSLPITQRPVISAPTFAPQWAGYTPQWGQSQIQQQYVSIDSQLLPIQQQTIAQPIPAAMDPTLNVFLSETRTQNTEIRMGLSKISDNVQKLLDKFHVLELQQASTPPNDKSLETTLKMFMDLNKSKQNFESRDQEAQCALKKDETSDDQNLILMNKQLNTKLNTIENELKEANESIIAKSKYIDELSNQGDAEKRNNSMMMNRIKELEKKLSASGDKVEELSNESDRFKNIESGYKEQNFELENRITKLTTKCKEMEQKMWKLESNSWVDKSKEIKEIMSQTFQELCDSFSDDNYTSDYIKATIHSTLRNITFQVVSQEAEKKKKKARRSRDEPTSSDDDHDSNFAKHDDASEDTMSTSPNDSLNSSIIDSNTVSAFQNEPPPLPKFDLDGDN